MKPKALKSIGEKIDKEYQALLNAEFNSKGSLRPIIEILYEAFRNDPGEYLTASQLLKNTAVSKKRYVETAQRYTQRRINNQILGQYRGKNGSSFWIEKNGNAYRLRVKFDGKDYLAIKSRLDEGLDFKDCQKKIASKIDIYIENVCAKTSEYYSKKFILTDVTVNNTIEYDIEKDPLVLQDLMADAFNPENKELKMTVIEGLERFSKEHVLLIGKPGSGKTTALHRFLLRSAQKGQRDQALPIPILISLKYFRTSIEDLILKTLESYQIDFSRDEVDHLIKSKRFIYLFDGINEAPSQETLDILSNFIEGNPDVPMIFTTRPFSKGGGLRINRRLELLPLTDRQIRQYAKKMLSRHTDFINKLDFRHEGLARNPLFLYMLIKAYEAGGKSLDLSSLGKAIRQYIEILVHSLKKAVNVTQDEKERWQAILQRIAFRMTKGVDLKNPQLLLNGKKAIKIISEMTFSDDSGAKQILRNLIDFHHIVGHLDGKIEFNHQMIQEYFAAEYLLGYLPPKKDDEIKSYFLNYTKWTEPLAIMLGLCNDRAFIERIIDLSIEVDRMLAARLAGAVESRYRRYIIEKIMPLYANEQLKVEAFWNIRGQEAIDFMLPLITKDDMPYNKFVIRFLGRYEREKTIEHLISRLESKHHAFSDKLKTIKILGSMESVEANENINHSFSIQYIDPILTAAQALGSIEGKNVSEYLIPLIANEDDNNAKGLLIGALESAGSPGIVDYLISLLEKEDTSLDILKRIIQMLARLGDKRAVDPLISLLGHPNSLIELHTIRALGCLEDKRAVDSLVPFIEDDLEFTRMHAIAAIAKIKKCLSTEEFSSMMEISKPYLIVDVIKVLGKLGTAEAVDQLLSLLKRRELSSVEYSLHFALVKRNFRNYASYANYCSNLLILQRIKKSRHCPLIVL